MTFRHKSVIILAVSSFFSPVLAGEIPVSPAQQQQFERFQRMNPAERQDRMRDMQERMIRMQECMGGDADKAAMQELKAKGEALQKEIQALCAAGKPQDAKELAMTKGKALSEDPRVKKLQACFKDMAEEWRSLIPEYDMGKAAENNKNFDICKQG